MANGAECIMQTAALLAAEPFHGDLVAGRQAGAHIGQLLGQDQLKELSLRASERVEILRPTAAERGDGGEPRRRRTLDEMMADRQHTRGGDDAEQAGLLEIDAAVHGAEAAQHGDAGLHRTRGIGQELGKGCIALRGIEGAAPQVVGEHRIAMHADEIEQDIDRQEIGRIGAGDPSLLVAPAGGKMRARDTAIVTERDVLRALSEHGADALARPAASFASKPLVTLTSVAFSWIGIAVT